MMLGRGKKVPWTQKKSCHRLARLPLRTRSAWLYNLAAHLIFNWIASHSTRPWSIALSQFITDTETCLKPWYDKFSMMPFVYWFLHDDFYCITPTTTTTTTTSWSTMCPSLTMSCWWTTIAAVFFFFFVGLSPLCGGAKAVQKFHSADSGPARTCYKTKNETKQKKTLADGNSIYLRSSSVRFLVLHCRNRERLFGDETRWGDPTKKKEKKRNAATRSRTHWDSGRRRRRRRRRRSRRWRRGPAAPAPFRRRRRPSRRPAALGQSSNPAGRPPPAGRRAPTTSLRTNVLRNSKNMQVHRGISLWLQPNGFATQRQPIRTNSNELPNPT